MTLEDDVHAKIAAEVRRTGRPYKQVVNELLRRALVMEVRIKKRQSFRVGGRALVGRPGLNYGNIGELLEQLEGHSHP